MKDALVGVCLTSTCVTAQKGGHSSRLLFLVLRLFALLPRAKWIGYIMQCSQQIRWQAKNGVPKQTYFLTSALSVPGLLADPCMRVYFFTWMARFQLVRRFHTYWSTFKAQQQQKLWPLENTKFIYTDKKRLEGTKIWHQKFVYACRKQPVIIGDFETAIN